jgi:hypothetical protein
MIGSAVIDHPLPRTMRRLHILLFDALLRDKGNVGFGVRSYNSLDHCRRTNGFTYCGLIIFSWCQIASNLRAQ